MRRLALAAVLSAGIGGPAAAQGAPGTHRLTMGEVEACLAGSTGLLRAARQDPALAREVRALAQVDPHAGPDAGVAEMHKVAPGAAKSMQAAGCPFRTYSPFMLALMEALEAEELGLWDKPGFPPATRANVALLLENAERVGELFTAFLEARDALE